MRKTVTERSLGIILFPAKDLTLIWVILMYVYGKKGPGGGGAGAVEPQESAIIIKGITYQGMMIGEPSFFFVFFFFFPRVYLSYRRPAFFGQLFSLFN